MDQEKVTMEQSGTNDICMGLIVILFKEVTILVVDYNFFLDPERGV